MLPGAGLCLSRLFVGNVESNDNAAQNHVKKPFAKTEEVATLYKIDTTHARWPIAAKRSATFW